MKHTYGNWPLSEHEVIQNKGENFCETFTFQKYRCVTYRIKSIKMSVVCIFCSNMSSFRFVTFTPEDRKKMYKS